MWRSLKTAAWLGWQIESNWASPFLFAIYSIVKPITGAAILVVMFGIVTDADFGSPAFAFMFVGNAFYMYVGAVLGGMAQAVVDDRERFRTLKSMYVAPVDIRMYLAGRGLARFATTSFSVIVILSFGVAFLGLPIGLDEVRWGWLAMTIVAGMVMLALSGLMLASFVLTIAHSSWLVGEAVAAALYLFCGAVFPIDVLPRFLQPIGYLLPMTYWLELVRRSLSIRVAADYCVLSNVTDEQLLAIVIAMTGALAAGASLMFRRCDNVARERGLIDRTTNY
jgi:ABC-2 type transport system permease protein